MYFYLIIQTGFYDHHISFMGSTFRASAGHNIWSRPNH